MVTVGDIKKEIEEKDNELLKCLIVIIPESGVCSLILEKVREPFPIFFINNNYSLTFVDMRIPANIEYALPWCKRFRSIIDARKVFRCEDLDMLHLNSSSFKSLPKFVSGSTYVQDGNLKVFQDSITEIEEHVKYYESFHNS